MRKQITTETVRLKKGGSDPITLVTAYDYPMARWADEAGIDVVMVSDAFASVGLGRENAFSVTIEETIYHTRAVRAGSGSCLTVATMPFLSYARRSEAVTNAGRLIKEAGAHAVELEGDAGLAKTVSALRDAGIPVLAHVGLTKTVSSLTGGYRTQGRTAEGAIAVVKDAVALADAGAFAVLLECIPDRVAKIITKKLDVPTIGIGAGPFCDGQALVSQDLLGMFDKFCPAFVKRYAALGDTAIEAMQRFRTDVAQQRFPAAEHTRTIDDDAFAALDKALKRSIK